jgi:neurexin
LGIPYEGFNNSGSQKRFVERLSQIFNDQSVSNIQIRTIRPIFNYTLVSFYNTTLYRMHQRCPDDEIETIKNTYVHSYGSLRDRPREILGSEFNLLNVSLVPVGTCQGMDTIHHDSIIPMAKPDDPPPPHIKDDYLLTFVLPAVIIVVMLLLAASIAYYLHRRRLTGKMELGDEEERKSFRSKGIPVIFQDELDEKPEIGNKSPVILKDEKPPLLPPSYNSTNPDDNDDMDDYVPPPAVLMGGRESRGKSPVTPSYRKPPPYVSP